MVIWSPPFDGADSEWTYFGEGKEVNLNLIQRVITQHLQSEELWLDLGRHRSRQVDQVTLISEFNALISVDNLVLWDTQFHRVIEFAQLGVLRLGARSA